MKNILIALLTLSFFAVSAQKFESAIEFNDFIIDEQTKIGEKIVILMDEFEIGTRESAKVKHQELIVQTKASLRALQSVKSFTGGARFKQASLSLFNFYQSICETEYARMIDIYFSEDYSDEDVAELTKMMEDITAREKAYDEEFAAAQEEFAKANGFDLKENELQKEFDTEDK